MKKTFALGTAIALLAVAALVFVPAASAQDKKTATPETKSPAKPAAKPAAKPDAKSDAKTEAKPAAKPQAKAKSDPTEQAVLLGQFGDWGAYTATPEGKKVCFALAKPTTAVIEPSSKKRDPSYAFVSTRPSEKVRNEVSVIVGYPQKASHDASAAIGSANYVMYTQNDGAWVKNAAEEAQMVDAMRKGSELVVKSESKTGAKTTDTYTLKGLAQALEKVAAECK